MKIYMGCSLAEGHPLFDSFVMEVLEAIPKTDEVLNFLGREVGVPGDVYRHDIAQVLSSSMVVALCDYPSFGLGFEVCTALGANIPVLAFGRRGRKISRFVQGIQHELYQFTWYECLQDILDEIERVRLLLVVPK